MSFFRKDNELKTYVLSLCFWGNSILRATGWSRPKI